MGLRGTPGVPALIPLAIYPWDDYQLLASPLVGRDVHGEFESDLFAGLA
jgi:hypothetical protein